MTYNQFKPSVMAELEEWDETTDVIVWIIENSEKYHLSCPNLELERNPEQRYGRSSYETLENQSAQLTGYTEKHEKIKFTFNAEFTYIKVSDPEADDGVSEQDAYLITVEKQNPKTFRDEPFEKLTVKGSNRKDFELI